MIKEIKEIGSIPDLQKMVRFGFDDWGIFGNVNTRTSGDLILFNYTAQAQFDSRWNYFERISRGLILNRRTGEVVARPFDKFFNWGEGGRTTSARMTHAFEKMDGSLGILYRDGRRLKVATRGSFDSEQALWATEYLKRKWGFGKLAAISDEATLLFEIIYPGNRIVVDYRGVEKLSLLAIRNRFTGAYYSHRNTREMARWLGFSAPKSYSFGGTEDILAEAAKVSDGTKAEGWVVWFEDGSIFKFKTAAYLKLHRLLSNLSFKNVLIAVQAGEVDQIKTQIPDEFMAEFDGWTSEIQETVAAIKGQVEEAYHASPQDSRKDYALHVKANYPHLLPYMFARLDGKPIEPIIYKRASEYWWRLASAAHLQGPRS